jgi:hypothetical protein
MKKGSLGLVGSARAACSSSAHDANAGPKLLSNQNLNFISVRRDAVVLAVICVIAMRKSR